MPRGGKRPGAGRPKGSKDKRTLLREQVIAQAQGDAQQCFQLLVDMALGEGLKPELQRACANDVLDRVWGKPVETQNLNVKAKATVEHELADDAVADLLSILASAGALKPGAEESGDPKAQ